MNQLTNLKLKVWRQAGPETKGHFESYTVDKVSDEASFLEMLDQLNERLSAKAKKRLFLIMIVAKEFAELVR